MGAAMGKGLAEFAKSDGASARAGPTLMRSDDWTSEISAPQPAQKRMWSGP